MSTYTDSLGLEEITPGDQAGLWGNTTNNNLALIDQAVTGVTPISFLGLSGSVKILDSSNGALDEARAAVLNITGLATGTNTVVIPNKQKTYLVRNDTGRDVIFRTATPGATFTVEAGNSILVFCDGDNGVFTGIASASVGPTTVPGGGTGVSTFGAGGFVKSPGAASNLTAVAAIDLNSSDVTNTLQVSRGGTGAGVFTAGSLLIGNGTSNFGVLVGGANGQVATWNGSTWTAATPTTGSGTVTSVSGTGSGLGFALSGTVTSSGNITLSAPTGSTLAANIDAVTLSGTQTISGTKTFSSQINVGSSSDPIFITGAGFLGLGRNLGTSTAGTAPFFDNSANLGGPSLRWAQVYAAIGTINTSDVNQKTEIADLDAAEKRVATRIKGLVKKFKFKDAVAKKGTNARIHVGVIAQEVKAAFEAEGLNPDRYSLFCFDQWDATPATLDAEGKVLTPAIPAGSAYGIRYDELLAFVIAAL
jgi:hypothetical protein